MSKAPIRVAVTGAAGQIGYSLIPLIATGQVFGDDQPVILHLVDIPRAEKMLGAVHMEIQDGAYPLVVGVVEAVSVEDGFKEIDYAILVGGFPRLAGMERKDLLAKNRDIFVSQGKALDTYAKKTVKTLVVANPANTNCLVAATNAPSIPKSNFSALTRLDHNRARFQLANKLGTTPGLVKNLTIWGNHSATMYVDASKATYTLQGSDEVRKVTDNVDAEWLQGEFLTTVQQRGASVIKARGLSSAMSAANAVKDHMRAWVLGTPEGETTSMAVYTTGEYGVEAGLVFSLPVECCEGQWAVESGRELGEFGAAALKKTEAELVGERSVALSEN